MASFHTCLMHTVPAMINMGLYVHLLLCLIYLPIYLYYLIFKNISLSLCMYVHTYHTYVCRYSQRPEEVSTSLGVGVAGGCEFSDLGARK